MKTSHVILIVVILGVFLAFQQYLIRSNPPSIDDQILQKIESIENKLDTLSNRRDSVKTLIIQVEEKIDSNKQKHEKVVDNIFANNDSANREFIGNYIKQYIERVTKE